MLVIGQFNYGRRGILDLTHTRLFTFATLRRLLEGASFRIVEERGVVAPFTKAVGETRLARTLLGVNQGLVRLRRELFSYQAFVVAQPRLSLPHLLTEARQHSRDRADSLASWAPNRSGRSRWLLRQGARMAGRRGRSGRSRAIPPVAIGRRLRRPCSFAVVTSNCCSLSMRRRPARGALVGPGARFPRGQEVRGRGLASTTLGVHGGRFAQHTYVHAFGNERGAAILAIA